MSVKPRCTLEEHTIIPREFSFEVARVDDDHFYSAERWGPLHFSQAVFRSFYIRRAKASHEELVTPISSAC